MFYAVIGGRARGIGSSTMPGGRRRHRDHLHFATKPRRHGRAHRFPIRLVAALVAIVALLVAAACIRAATAPAPRLAVRATSAGSVVLAGAPPVLAWPTGGEAAVAVNGMTLGHSQAAAAVPIASLAKVMTAYLVLRDHPLAAGSGGFSVTVTAADARDYEQRATQAESVVRVSAGETLTEEQLLEGLLVPSANNYATILADYDAGSTTAFVARMNAVAAGLGMTHTHYTDPAGLAPTTVSDATDQLALALRAMAIPAFARIVALRSVVLPDAGTVANYNTLVGANGYVGIKTGSDSTAGGCLAFANDQTVDGAPESIVGVVIGQDAGTVSTQALIGAAVKAANALVASVRAAVSMRTLVAAGTVVAVASNPQGHRVDLDTTSDIRQLGFSGETVPLRLTLRPVGTTLRAGQAIGTLQAGTGPASAVTARAGMPAVTFSWKLLHDL